MKGSVILKRTASTTASVGNITAPASSMRRFRLFFFETGCEDTPNDNAFDLILQRCTTTGTRTTVTPQPFDPADAAFATTAGQNHTVEPTYTSNAVHYDRAFNQRATVQWYSPDKEGIIVPATANNGLGIQTPTAPALKITVTAHIDEL